MCACVSNAGDFEGYSADHRHPVLEGKGNGKEEEEAAAGGGDDHQANHHDGGDDVIGEFVNAGAHETSIVSSTPVYLQQPLSASHHRKKNKNKEKTEKDDWRGRAPQSSQKKTRLMDPWWRGDDEDDKTMRWMNDWQGAGRGGSLPL